MISLFVRCRSLIRSKLIMTRMISESAVSDTLGWASLSTVSSTRISLCWIVDSFSSRNVFRSCNLSTKCFSADK